MKNALKRKFETIAKGAKCGHFLPANHVVRKQAEWQKLWAETNSGCFPATPKINFAKRWF